jgi:endo-1,3-1,4-beta-glycanase ExoK
MGRLILVGLVALAAIIGGTAYAVVGRGDEKGNWNSTAASSTAEGSGQAAGAATPSTALPASPSAASSASSASPSPAVSSRAATPAVDPTDDFSGAALDRRWGIYHSTFPNGSSWVKSMVGVRNGELQIVGSGKNPTGKGNVTGGVCWCSAGGNQIYGKWQVRAKFDAGAGYGQIIGLWPQSDKQSDGAVVFAATRDTAKHSLHGYVVWTNGSLVSDGGALTGDFTGWHTYTVEWRATYIKVQVDQTLIYDSTKSKVKVVIPSGPMHLYLQQEAGPQDGIAAPDASTPDQVTMHVDWVHMYP